MKPIFFIAIAGLFASLAGCKDVPFEDVPRSRSYLHIINTYADAGDVDFFVESFESEGVFASRLGFLSTWPKGGYASLITHSGFEGTLGDPEIFLTVVERGTAREVLPREGIHLTPDIHSTIALIDSFGKSKIVKTVDVLTEVPDTAAHVRFMNLNYTMESVSMVNDTAAHDVEFFRIPQLNFLNYSSFEVATPGTQTFTFVDDRSNIIVATIKDVTLEAGKIYNFVLTQKGGAPRAIYETLSPIED